MRIATVSQGSLDYIVRLCLKNKLSKWGCLVVKV